MKSQNASQAQTMIKATKVEALDDYSIVVSFEDGRILKLDLSHIKNLNGPVIEPLKKFSQFKKVFIEDGIVTWPTGHDIDPFYILETGAPHPSSSSN